MSYELRLREDNKILEVRHLGRRLSVEEARQAREAAKPLVTQYGVRHILADIRDTKPCISIAGLFDFNVSHAQVFPSNTAIACIYSPDEMALDDIKFAETVAINRGVVLRAFSQEQEALEWLMAQY